MPEKKQEKQKEKQKQEKQKEEKKEKKEKKEKEETKKEKQKEKHEPKKEKKQERIRIEENLIRVLSTDIPADMRIYPGLTKIKGVSWSFSNALCNILKMNKNKKMSELSESELKKITDFIKNPALLPPWLFNRRKDFETGQDKHLVATDLDLQKDFDIRAMKKMKSYKGVRHIMGQPVRGQRTKAHFRKGRAIGVQRVKVSSKSKK